MGDTLDAAKARVRREFLGREGVHGIGLRRAEDTVVVYVEGAPDFAALRARLEAAAAPHTVAVVMAPRASSG